MGRGLGRITQRGSRATFLKLLLPPPSLLLQLLPPPPQLLLPLPPAPPAATRVASPYPAVYLLP
jgi:hypothetical protein